MGRCGRGDTLRPGLQAGRELDRGAGENVETSSAARVLWGEGTQEKRHVQKNCDSGGMEGPMTVGRRQLQPKSTELNRRAVSGTPSQKREKS